MSSGLAVGGRFCAVVCVCVGGWGVIIAFKSYFFTFFSLSEIMSHS